MEAHSFVVLQEVVDIERWLGHPELVIVELTLLYLLGQLFALFLFSDLLFKLCGLLEVIILLICHVSQHLLHEVFVVKLVCFIIVLVSSLFKIASSSA